MSRRRDGIVLPHRREQVRVYGGVRRHSLTQWRRIGIERFTHLGIEYVRVPDRRDGIGLPVFVRAREADTARVSSHVSCHA